MKLQILSLTTLLTLTIAQNLAGEPACATGCLASAISKAGCAPTDQACQCGPTQSIIGNYALTCLVASCSATQLVAIQSIGEALCSSYSAGLTAVTTTAPITTSTVTAATLSSGPGPVVPSTTSVSGTGSSVVTTTAGTSTVTSILGSNSTSVTGAGGNSTVVSAKHSTSTGTGSSGGSSSAAGGGAGGGSSTTSAPATASSSAAMSLLISGVGGLTALFFAVVGTL